MLQEEEDDDDVPDIDDLAIEDDEADEVGLRHGQHCFEVRGWRVVRRAWERHVRHCVRLQHPDGTHQARHRVTSAARAERTAASREAGPLAAEAAERTRRLGRGGVRL